MKLRVGDSQGIRRRRQSRLLSAERSQLRAWRGLNRYLLIEILLLGWEVGVQRQVCVAKGVGCLHWLVVSVLCRVEVRRSRRLGPLGVEAVTLSIWLPMDIRRRGGALWFWRWGHRVLQRLGRDGGGIQAVVVKGERVFMASWEGSRTREGRVEGEGGRGIEVGGPGELLVLRLGGVWGVGVGWWCILGLWRERELLVGLVMAGRISTICIWSGVVLLKLLLLLLLWMRMLVLVLGLGLGLLLMLMLMLLVQELLVGDNWPAGGFHQIIIDHVVRQIAEGVLSLHDGGW